MYESTRKLIDSFGPLSYVRRRELEDYADYLENCNKIRYAQIMREFDVIINKYKD